MIRTLSPICHPPDLIANSQKKDEAVKTRATRINFLTLTELGGSHFVHGFELIVYGFVVGFRVEGLRFRVLYLKA